VDGTGAVGYPGNVLIREGRIARMGPGQIRWNGLTIDCTGKAVCPGFIDAHSHLDWHLPLRGRDELKLPFTAQGVTSLVAGNCGFSAAGFRESSAHRDRIEDNIFHAGFLKPAWDSVEQYFSFLASQGLSHNLALLAGHGTTRMSLRGLDHSPLHPYESLEMLRLLESAMDQGARGVSLGLQYEPGMYAPREEIVSVAKLVHRKDGILSVHLRSYSALSMSYPLRFLGEPHNLIALREALDVARESGVRLQISHLGFAGNGTWRTRDRALGMLDEARRQGVDVAFDARPFPCGASSIGAILPPWFLARVPDVLKDRRLMRRACRDLGRIRRLHGFGCSDIQVSDAREPDLKRYDGMFLPQIARLRHTTVEQVALEFACRTRGLARVLCHRLGDDSTLDALIRHPAALFISGAWVENGGIQDPGAFGAFPRFLRLARERGLVSMEEAVRKMTGSAADRFHLAQRGVLRAGGPADVVVFDPETVSDRETEDGRPAGPEGIEYVFLNGRKVISCGRHEGAPGHGMTLT